MLEGTLSNQAFGVTRQPNLLVVILIPLRRPRWSRFELRGQAAQPFIDHRLAFLENRWAAHKPCHRPEIYRKGDCDEYDELPSHRVAGFAVGAHLAALHGFDAGEKVTVFARGAERNASVVPAQALVGSRVASRACEFVRARVERLFFEIGACRVLAPETRRRGRAAESYLIAGTLWARTGKAVPN